MINCAEKIDRVLEAEVISGMGRKDLKDSKTVPWF